MMTPWYEKMEAKIGLRVVGLILLVSTWPEGGLLRRLVLATPTTDMSAAEFLLAALLFLTASAGAALLAMGPRLWKPVQLSARWERRD